MFDFATALKRSTTFPVRSQSVAFDFETTGVHLHHDSLPFMMSATWDDGRNTVWTAEVDPTTRTPIWNPEDVLDIAQLFSASLDDTQGIELIASNAKFDTRCADVLLNKMHRSNPAVTARNLRQFDGVSLLRRCHDTIQQHHVLANAEPHDLKSAAIKYIKVLDTDESDLHNAVKEARRLAIPLGWKVASKVNCPQQARTPDKGWAVMDMWLPRAYAKHMWEQSPAGRFVADCLVPRPVFAREQQIFLSPTELTKAKLLDGWKFRPPSEHWSGSHSWWTLCAKYCSMDTTRSLILHEAFSKMLQEQKLHSVYMENRTSLPISYETENTGITIHYETAHKLLKQFTTDRENAVWAMSFALGKYGQFNPASTTALRYTLYERFKLPVLVWTKDKNKRRTKTFVPQPSTDSDAISTFANLFRQQLTDPDVCAPPLWQRECESYAEFETRCHRWHDQLIEHESPSPEQVYAFCCALLMWKKCNTSITQLTGWLRAAIPHPLYPEKYGILYPSLNPVGTRTTRYSSSNPNGQNISKGGKKKKGLEWLFKTDHSLRCVFGPISGEEWWTIDYHQIQLAIFAVCAGDEKMIAAFKRGEDFHTFVAKEIFGSDFDPDPDSTIHKSQRDIAKTVNFAFIFGAQEEKLNQSSGMPGLYKRLAEVFPKAIRFLQETEDRVKRGYPVYTLGGYKLTVPETAPYSGVCYIVQGTEGEIVKRAQYGISAYLQKYDPDHSFASILYVHDELVFKCPASLGRQHVGPVIRIMNDAALSFNIPTTAQPSLVTEHWGKKTEVAV